MLRPRRVAKERGSPKLGRTGLKNFQKNFRQNGKKGGRETRRCRACILVRGRQAGGFFLIIFGKRESRRCRTKDVVRDPKKREKGMWRNSSAGCLQG